MKKLSRKKLVFGIASISCVFFCCEKIIEIEIPNESPKLVLYSNLFFSDDTAIKNKMRIDLQSSIHVFDTVKKLAIYDADILFFEGFELIDSIPYDDSLRSYILPFFSPKQNTTYKITAFKEGFPLAETSTLIPSNLDPVNFTINPVAFIDQFGGAFSEVRFGFKDEASETNYYEVSILTDRLKYYRLSSDDARITKEKYYPSILSIDPKYPEYLLFSDEGYNGNNIEIGVFYVPPQFHSDRRYISPHTINIQFRKVSKEYYKHRTTILEHLNSREDDVLFGNGDIEDVYSNVNNGFGLFGSYSERVAKFHIKQTPV